MTDLDERMLDSTIGTLELFGVYIGTQLGLYQALHDSGPLTAADLSAVAGVHPRYAREWLEQQAVAGYLAVDTDDDHPESRTFVLPEAHAPLLVDPEDASYLAPFADAVVGIADVLEDVVRAYRTGGGVPYSRYGAAFRNGQGGMNRPAFTHDLTGSWLPAVTDLHHSLRESGARIADLGCGQGFSTIALARAYPDAHVVGIDLDASSIDDARANARDVRVPVRFVHDDASEVSRQGPFDAIVILESLHDFARPVEILAAARAALAPGGSVLVVDEKVQDEFTAPGDRVERLMYGWSISHCLPSQRAEPDSASLGTVLRAERVRELAAAAGFSRVDVADVDAGFFRVYRLLP